MSATVREIMNPELFNVGPGVSAAATREGILAMGITAAAVLDGNHAVGMVSAVDLVRALSGLPAQHPAAFPHLDTKTGLIWTDDTVLDMAISARPPTGPG